MDSKFPLTRFQRQISASLISINAFDAAEIRCLHQLNPTDLLCVGRELKSIDPTCRTKRQKYDTASNVECQKEICSTLSCKGADKKHGYLASSFNCEEK